MAQATTPAAVSASLETVLERVLAVVRELAKEVGGERAARAAAPEASLEREVGLGSLERVELLLRLESAFGRALDDRFLGIDTPAALAQALLEAGASEPLAMPEQAPAVAPAAAPRERPATVHGALWLRAESDPGRPHVYMREDDGREHTIAYGALLTRARAIAGGLRERGVRRGDTVALMLPTGEEFLASFQAILIAGAVPVPIYPPLRLDRLEEYARRQAAILADAGVVLLITVPRAMPIAGLLRPAVASLAHVTTAGDLADLGAVWRSLEGSGNDPAFIQYTSGSTGSPKGVLLTHDNLLANVRAIGAALEARPTDVGASWLPLYHDMGLIGTWLFCMHDGLPLDLQSPTSFLARPERWLWAIHRRGATLSAAPNFAYELCARKVSDSALEGLDLSSWRCALNGAEPVNPDTLERFARRFAPYGFRREALLPVYGLAENSVALCFPPVHRGPLVDRVARGPFERERRAEPAREDDKRALRFVSVGRAVPEHEVRVVDEAGEDVPERSVGRLVFRGPSMTQGYFRKPEATAAIALPGGWLDSGDLAYAAGGEVYITSRLKDLIIKAGRNLVPQEIEEVAASVEGVRKGCVVAFGISNPSLGTESLVVVAETRVRDEAEKDRLAAAVTERVAAAVAVPPDAVALVPPGAVPKTSSGKVRRSATKDLYLSGQLGRAARTSLARRLGLLAAAAWSEVQPRLRVVPRALYAAYLGLVLAAAAPLVWGLGLLLPGRRAVRAVERFTCRTLLRLSGCRLSVEGLDNVAGRGPYLLVSNHASYADVPTVLALLPMSVLFVAKKEVLTWPIVGTFVRRCGHITVDRWDAHQSVSDAGQVAAALEEGDSVMVFPEGTFVGATGLRPFRLGAFKTAVDTGIPIVPMALCGTRRILRGETWLPRPGRIQLWIGAPIAPEGEGWRAVVGLRDRVAAAIEAHCGEPRLDIVAGGPPRD